MKTAPSPFIGPGHTFWDELIIRSIKIIDIGYVTTIYFLSAFFVSIYLDKLYGKFDPKEADKKPKYIIYIEIILQFALLGILTYFARNIIEHLPFPLNGVRGYNHWQLKELTSASLFAVILILFQTNLHDKLMYVAQTDRGVWASEASEFAMYKG